LGDFVVARMGGEALYLLANVVDDWTQEVTHILRGEDHISNTPKQVLIYQALGATPPVFGHIPLVLDSKKQKLSKRNVDPTICVTIEDFRSSGFVPQAVVNGLALTGWNPKTTEEIFTLQQLIEIFDIKNVNPAAAQYNFEKMKWFNTHWVRNLPLETLLQQYNDFAGTAYDVSHLKALEVARTKARDLHEVRDQLVYLLQDPGLDREKLLNEKMNIDAQVLKKIFPALKSMLEGIDESVWNAATIQEASVKQIEALGLKNGQFLNPFRVALSNQPVSSGPFEICEAIGKDEALKRIERALKD
jgi:glutamyl-tRNA synthetase